MNTINNHDMEKLMGFVYGYKKPKATSQDMISMAKAIETTGGYINDHNQGYSDADKIENAVGGIVLLANGKLCMWFGGGSCLNEAYIAKEDGLPHLSQWSVGGTIYRGPRKPDKESIEEYNSSTIDSCKIVDFVEVNL